MGRITFDDFSELDFRVGEILSVEKVPDTDKLLLLRVDMGEEKSRQIIAGIREYVERKEDLVGMQAIFVANLEPREIRGYESNGMILAISSSGGGFSLVIPEKSMPPGSKVR